MSRNPLLRAEFPRSNAYEAAWILEHQMGPNALWLAEWLCRKLDLRPEMRVLDLGCGTALTSIFLAREFGVRVWATDLWVHPDDNWERVRQAGLEDRVTPVRAEAHALPYASGFFDAIVSIDAYQYFGTDELYLGYVSRFLRAGGRLGIVVPGLMRSFEEEVPAHLTRRLSSGVSFWEDECACFLTRERWLELWQRSSHVEAVTVDTLPHGWRYWRDFELELERAGKCRFPSVAEALEEDQGRFLGFVRLVAVRTGKEPSVNLYDPGLLASFHTARSKG